MRLFVGIPIPAHMAAYLVGVAGAVALSHGGLRVSRVENLHITLAFLGEVEEARIPQILEHLGRIRRGEFAVNVGPLGGFPGVLLAEVERVQALLELQREVAETLQGLGFRLEERPYHPHVTLARSRERRWIRCGVSMDVLGCVVDKFVVYRSSPGAGGSRYEILREFPLAG